MRVTKRSAGRARLGLLVAVIGLGQLSCTPAAFYNNTVTLGGTTPGQRGSVNVMFINETPYRAVFTFGTYDPQNTTANTSISFDPEFDQFTVDADPAQRLEAFSSSEVFTFTCGRALSVGGERLVQVLEENNLATDADPVALKPLPDPTTGEAQQRAGIAFSDRGLDDGDAAAPTAGWSEGTVTLQGFEYQCGSLLTYTFVQDNSQPGGIRIDLDVILP